MSHDVRRVIAPERERPRRRANRRVRKRVVRPIRWRRLGAQVLGVGLLGFLGLAGWYGWQFLLQSPKLHIRYVEVVGVRGVRAQEVLAYAAVPLGTSILTLSLDPIAARIQQHPWIRTASVHRRLPDRVRIDVTEHIPSLRVRLRDVYMADEDGDLFKQAAAHEGEALPLLTGLDRQAALQRMGRTIERVREGIGLAAAVENHGTDLGVLSELHWDDDLGWSVMVQGSGLGVPGLQIHLGRQPLRRLERAIATVRLCAQRQQSPAIIWVDGVRNPDRVQVRLHTARPSGPPELKQPRGAPQPRAQSGNAAAAVHRTVWGQNANIWARAHGGAYGTEG